MKGFGPFGWIWLSFANNGQRLLALVSVAETGKTFAGGDDIIRQIRKDPCLQPEKVHHLRRTQPR